MKKIDEMAIGGMNTIGSGAIDGAGDGDIPPVGGKAFKKMKDCAKRHKRHKKKKKKHNISEGIATLAGLALAAVAGHGVYSAMRDDAKRGYGPLAKTAAKEKKKSGKVYSAGDPGKDRSGMSELDKYKEIHARIKQRNDPNSKLNQHMRRRKRVKQDQLGAATRDMKSGTEKRVKMTPTYAPSASNNSAPKDGNKALKVGKKNDGTSYMKYEEYLMWLSKG